MGQMKDQDSDNVAFDLQSGHDNNIQNEVNERVKNSFTVSLDLQSANNDNIHRKDIKKKYKCTYSECNDVFLQPSRLKRHMRRHVGERPYLCEHPGCTKSYTNSSHLKRHTETHKSIQKVYRCTECPMIISNLQNLKRHYKRTHGKDTEKLSCQECGEIFNKKYQLTQHQVKHFGPKIYKCNKCTKSYTNPSRLKRHAEIHEKGYPCPMPECSEVFDKWLLLRAHRKAKHFTNYKCEKCDKVFLYKRRLRAHFKIHSKNRLVIPCSYDNCHKTYLFKRNLEQHVRIKHLGEKFYCDICSIGLTTKRKLIEHIQHLHGPKKNTRSEKENKGGRKKKRKDAGIPKKSILTELVGIKLPYNLEKIVMERETIIINNNDNIAN